jgi:hypothetical protein
VVLLAVLAAADNGPASLEDVAEVARLLAPSTDWQPTTETIGTCVERAIDRGLLRPVERGCADDRMVVETTSAGRTVIVELLRQPIGRSSGGYMRACMSVKLCFLHYLPSTERSAQSDQLAELYREAIEPLRRLQHQLRPPAGAALLDLRYEMVCMESELAWLDGMRRWPPQR